MLAMAAILTTSGDAWTQQSATVVDKIVAKVDDYIILKSELEGTFLEMQSRGQSPTKCDILEGLVLNKLMVAKAGIDSIVVEEEMIQRELDMRMESIINQYGGDERIIEQYYGKSIEEMQSEIYDQIEEQMVVQKMQATITEGISVTPAEVKKFFKNIPRDSLPYFSTEVVIGQIVKKPEVGDEEKAQIENLLLQLKDRAEKGEDFQELARTYSMGPSGPRGGNLGNVKRGDMVPEFEAAALKLKEGAISLPVKTDFGFHIIQMVERRGNEYNARHILIQPKYNDKDLKKAGDYLDSLRVLIESDSITFDRAAKEYSEDKNTSSAGGFVRANDGSSMVPVSELDPSLFFTMDSMTVGTISKPLIFTQPDGSQAMRIIYFKKKLRPHQANLDDDYQKIYNAAINAKRSKAMNDWFIDARDDVFVLIEPEYQNCRILQNELNE